MSRHDHPTAPQGWGLPMGAGIGAGVGLMAGLMLDQLALGLVFGAAIGLVVGTTATTAMDIPAGRRRVLVATAIVIAAAGLAAVLVLWLS